MTACSINVYALILLTGCRFDYFVVLRLDFLFIFQLIPEISSGPYFTLEPNVLLR